MGAVDRRPVLKRHAGLKLDKHGAREQCMVA